MWVEEGQRERETQNPKQAPGSELSAQRRTRGSNSQQRDHDLSRSQPLNWLSHPGAPGLSSFLHGLLQSTSVWLFLFLYCPIYKIFFLFKNIFLFIFERERQNMSRGGAEREGDTESKADSRLWVVSTEPDVGLELRNHEIMTWAGVGCSTDWAT